MVTRRFVVAGLLAGSAGAAWANAPLSSIRPQARASDYQKYTQPSAEQLLEAAGLGGKVGFVVADAETGAILESHKPLLAQPPASVAKAITALYALDVLGAGHRFHTRLIAAGPVSSGRLQGDLILAGGGDPTLDTDGLGEMAAALKEAGIREITGRFRVHAGALPYVGRVDPTQPDHLGYNPSVSGLNLNYNRVYFEWKRQSEGYAVTMDARAKRFRPQVSVARMDVVTRDVPVYTYAAEAERDVWTVASGALGKEGGRWLPIRRPELYAAEVFQSLARSYGIVLRDPVILTETPVGAVLVDHASASLEAIIRDMLLYSTNLTAEVVGLAASVARAGAVADLQASGAMMSGWLKTHGARRPKFVDHSGLGDNSRITAQDMVAALVAAGPNGRLRGMLKPVIMRDAGGKVLDVPPVKAVAKTGTLNFVNSLAGYAVAGGGRQLAFAIFATDLPRRAGLREEEMERAPGGRDWNRRARTLQQQLLERWAAVYGA